MLADITCLKEQPKCIHTSNVQCMYLISIKCQICSGTMLIAKELLLNIKVQ